MACSPREESGWHPHSGAGPVGGERQQLFLERPQGMGAMAGEEGLGGVGEEQGLSGLWAMGAGAEEGERRGERCSNGSSTGAEGAFTPRGSRRSQHAADSGGSRRGGWKKDQEGGRRKDKGGAAGSAAGEGAAAAAAEATAAAAGAGEGGARDETGDVFAADEFRMYQFKVKKCMRSRSHDWTECPYAHPGEKARRRDPRKFAYTGAACPDFRKGSCRRGDACPYAHGVFECWLHPNRYRTEPCKDGTACTRRVCFFAHTPSQLRAAPPSSSPGASLSPSPPSTPHAQPGFASDTASYHSAGTDARPATPSPVQSPVGPREGSQGRQGLRVHTAHHEPEGACACAACSQRGWEVAGSAAHKEHAAVSAPFGGIPKGRDLGRSSSCGEPGGETRPKLLSSLSYHHHLQQQHQEFLQQYREAEGREQEGEGAAQHKDGAAGVHTQHVLEASGVRQGSFLQAKLGRAGGARLQLQIAEAAGEAFGVSSSGGGERDSESETFLGTPFSTWTPPSSSRSSNGFSTPGGAVHHGLAGWSHHGGMGGLYGGAPLAHPGLQVYAGSPTSDLGAVGQGAPDSPSSAQSLAALPRSVSMSPSLAPAGAAPGPASVSPPLPYLPGAPAAAYSLYTSLAGSQGQSQGQGEEAGKLSQGQGTRLGQQAMLSGSYGDAHGGTHRLLHLPPLAAPSAAAANHHALNVLCNGLAHPLEAGGTPISAGAPSPGSPLVLHSPHTLYHQQAASGVPMPGHHEGLAPHPGAAFPQQQRQQLLFHTQPQQPQQPEALGPEGEFVRSAPVTGVEGLGAWLRPCQESGDGALQPLEAQLQRLSLESWPAQEAFRVPGQQQKQQPYQQQYQQQYQQPYQQQDALSRDSRVFHDWRMSLSQHQQHHSQQQQQQQLESQEQGEGGVGASEGGAGAGHEELDGPQRAPRVSGARPPLLSSSSMPVHRVAATSPVRSQLPGQAAYAPPDAGAAGEVPSSGPGEGGEGLLFPRASSDSSHYMGPVSRFGGTVPRPASQAHSSNSHSGAAGTHTRTTEWKQHAGGLSPYDVNGHRMGFGAIIEGEEAPGDAGSLALVGAGAGQESVYAGYASAAQVSAPPPDLEWVTDLVLEEQGSGYTSGGPGSAAGTGSEAGGRAGEAAGGAAVACQAHSSSSVWSASHGGGYSPLF